MKIHLTDTQWRNLDEEIDKNLEEHFKKFANK